MGHRLKRLVLCGAGLAGAALVGGCTLIPGAKTHMEATSSAPTTVAALPAIANPPPPVIQTIAGGKVPANACLQAGHQIAPGVVYRAKKGTVTIPKGTTPREAFVVTDTGTVTGRTLVLPGRPATFPAAYAVIAVPAVLAPAAPLAQMKVAAKCAG